MKETTAKEKQQQTVIYRSEGDDERPILMREKIVEG